MFCLEVEQETCASVAVVLPQAILMCRAEKRGLRLRCREIFR